MCSNFVFKRTKRKFVFFFLEWKKKNRLLCSRDSTERVGELRGVASETGGRTVEGGLDEAETGVVGKLKWARGGFSWLRDQIQ